MKKTLLAIGVLALLAQGCTSPTGPARPAVLRVLDEKAHLLAGPETESASDAFSPDELALMRKEIATVRPVVLRELKNGNHGYAHLALALKLDEALPLMRKNLLLDRYFYGWEGPDYSIQEAYLRDEQYTHHLVYINAISALTGEPIAEAIGLTEDEAKALEADARKANLAPDNVHRGKYFCAKWLLAKLKKTKGKHNH